MTQLSLITLLSTTISVLCLIQQVESKPKNLGQSEQTTINAIPYFDDRRTPVIFIPGDGGCQMEAKLNKTDAPHYVCSRVSDWYDIWLNVHLLYPEVIDCTLDNLKLTYDRVTRRTSNTDGVDVRPTNFGSVDPVASLDIWNRLPGTDYFETIVGTLENKLNYTRNINMLGASYDFRKAPNELEEWFKNLTDMIEMEFVRNNYNKVTLICHSMGCLNSLVLLNSKSQNWKNVFVKRLITLGAPWDGSFEAITASLFGDDLGIPILNSYKLQQLQSTFPSLMYLFPKTPSFAENQTLVVWDKGNFSIANMDEMFMEFGMIDQLEMWHDTREIASKLSAPLVEMWCLYGSLPNSTREMLTVKGPIHEANYKATVGWGDGTVNLASLRACERFANEQEQPVFTREFPGLDHISILRKSEPAKFIAEKIMNRDLDADD